MPDQTTPETIDQDAPVVATEQPTDATTENLENTKEPVDVAISQSEPLTVSGEQSIAPAEIVPTSEDMAPVSPNETPSSLPITDLTNFTDGEVEGLIAFGFERQESVVRHSDEYDYYINLVATAKQEQAKRASNG